MRARVRAWVVGWGVGLVSAIANAQAPAAAFPPEPKPNAPTAAVATPPPAEPLPAVASAPDASPAAPATLAPPERARAPVEPPVLVPAPPPKRTPQWSLGAGIYSFGDSLNAFATSTEAPSYSTALERRLGERSWLALNLRLAYETREIVPYASNTDPPVPGKVRINTSRVGALLGVRYVFVRGLVDVSGSAAVFASLRHLSDGSMKASGITSQSGFGNNRDLGLLLGLAVERELIEALALRLSVDLATATVSSADSTRVDDAEIERHTALGAERVALMLQPGLQLHFYF